MNFDDRWTRWIKASINKYMQAQLPAGLTMFVEGQERETNKLNKWLEVRVEGPDWFKYSAGFHKGTVAVNILCSQQIIDDIYAMDRLTGIAQKMLFTTSIAVIQWGDDETQSVGCLQLISEANRNLETRFYGQIDQKTQLMLATVAAKFFIDIP